MNAENNLWMDIQDFVKIAEHFSFHDNPESNLGSSIKYVRKNFPKN